jgi:hypothetical protein
MSDALYLQCVPSGPLPVSFGSAPVSLPWKRAQTVMSRPLSPTIRRPESIAVSP